MVHSEPLGRAAVFAVLDKPGTFVVGVYLPVRHGYVLTHRIGAATATNHATRYLIEPASFVGRHGVVAHYLPRSFHHFAGYTGIWYRYGYPLVPRFLVRLPLPTILLTSAANLRNPLACGAGSVEPEDAVA